MSKTRNILRAMAEYEAAAREGRVPVLSREPNRWTAQAAVAIAARILPDVQANGKAGMPLRQAAGEAMIAALDKRLAETDETKGE